MGREPLSDESNRSPRIVATLCATSCCRCCESTCAASTLPCCDWPGRRRSNGRRWKRRRRKRCRRQASSRTRLCGCRWKGSERRRRACCRMSCDWRHRGCSATHATSVSGIWGDVRGRGEAGRARSWTCRGGCTCGSITTSSCLRPESRSRRSRRCLSRAWSSRCRACARSADGGSLPRSRAVASHARGCPRGALDATAMRGTLRVRRRRPGDRFQPLGLAGEKKLQDVFVDAKVPRSQRDSVPVVCDDEGIVWVAGYRIAERVKVTASTRRVLGSGRSERTANRQIHCESDR